MYSFDVYSSRNVMRDIMIVNPSGIPGHCIATDINMEYTIREIKVCSGFECCSSDLGDLTDTF